MTEQSNKASYMPLWILIAVCAFPYIAGTLYFQYQDSMPPGKTTNYGQLVSPVREATGIELIMDDGLLKPIEEYRKKWLMVYVLGDHCDEDCQRSLYYMRQVRKAMADERFRINRLLVLERNELMTPGLEQVLAAFPAMDVAILKAESKARFRSTFNSGSGSIFKKIMVVDPLGNFMMEYDQKPDPKRLLKDIKRLLAVSRIG